jgi:hypothetical protein
MGLLLAGGVCYGAVRLHMGPLISPYWFFRHSLTQPESYHTDPMLIRQSLAASLGTLVCVLPLLLLAPTRRGALGAILWTMIAFAPFLYIILSEGGVESRMFHVMLPPIGLCLGLCVGALLRSIRPRNGSTPWFVTALAVIFCGLLGFCINSTPAREALSKLTGITWDIPFRERRPVFAEALDQCARVLDDHDVPHYDVLRGSHWHWTHTTYFIQWCQERFHGMGPGRPLRTYPEGPWYALGTTHASPMPAPVQEVLQSSFQKENIHTELQAAAEVLTDHPAVLLYRITPLPEK